MPQHPGKQHGSHLSRDPREGQRRRITQQEALRHLQEAAEGGDDLAKRMLLAFNQRGQPQLSVGTGNEPVPGLSGVVRTPDGRIILAATGEEVSGDSGGLVNLAGGPALGAAKFGLAKLPVLKAMLAAPQRWLSRLGTLKDPGKKLATLKREVEVFRTKVGKVGTKAGEAQQLQLATADQVVLNANKVVAGVKKGQRLGGVTGAAERAVLKGEEVRLLAEGTKGVGLARLGTAAVATGAGVAAVAGRGASLGRTLGRNKLRTVGFLLGADYLGQKVEDVTGVDIPGINDLFDTGPSPQEVNAQAAQVQAAKEGAFLARGEGFITRAGQIRDQLVGDIVGRSQRGLEATKVDLESQALSKVQGRLNKVIEATGGRVTGEQALRAINTLQSPRMVQHFSLDEPNLKTQMDLEASIVEIMASPEFKQAGEPQNDLQEAGSGPQ